MISIYGSFRIRFCNTIFNIFFMFYELILTALIVCSFGRRNPLR